MIWTSNKSKITHTPSITKMNKREKKEGDVCTRRSCRYTEEQRTDAANQTEEFSVIVCNICQKKKWACSRCAKKASGSFAFISRDLHRKNRYVHSTLKRPSGIRTSKAATSFDNSPVPKMKPPRVFRSTKQEFVSASLLHAIHGYVPLNEFATGTGESQSCVAENQPLKLSMNDVKDCLPKVVWDCLDNLFKSGIVHYSREISKPFSLCTNNTENSYAPLRMDTSAKLLVVVGGMGHRKVFVAKNPGDANQIEDGVGVIWKKDEVSVDDGIVWNPQQTKESWQELMTKNRNANTVVSFTLVAGDALILPSGLLHGVLAYGTSSMLSIPVV